MMFSMNRDCVFLFSICIENRSNLGTSWNIFFILYVNYNGLSDKFNKIKIH